MAAFGSVDGFLIGLHVILPVLHCIKSARLKAHTVYTVGKLFILHTIENHSSHPATLPNIGSAAGFSMNHLGQHHHIILAVSAAGRLCLAAVVTELPIR